MIYQNDNLLFTKTQKYLNWFVFFLPIGMIKIVGISITFFIFLMIVYIFLKNNRKIFRVNKHSDYGLIALFLLFFISMIFAEETYREVSTFFLFKISFQYVYWFALAMFVKTWIFKYDFVQLSKYFFYGVIALIFYKYVMNPIALIYPNFIGYIPRNTFTFFLVISVPLAMYYTYQKYSFIKNMLISLGFLFFAAISQSRTGMGLMFLELSTLLVSARPRIKKGVIIFFIIVTPLIGVMSTQQEIIREYASQIVEPFNPRMAKLIANPNRLESIDKPWLIRKLMVQKGLKIFEEHPFFGIGTGHFKYYWVNLEIKSRQLYMGLASYNRRSSHNAYVKTLAESGIFALLSLVSLQLLILIKGFKYIAQLKFSAELFIYISFVGMSIYWYVISAITGAIPWFIFGLGMALLSKKEIQ